MNEQNLIQQGQLGEKRLARTNALLAAKAARRALVSAATYAMNKPIEEVNTAEIKVYLEQLIAKQEEVQRIDAEIKELSY